MPSWKYIRNTCLTKKKIDRSRVNELTHLFNFKRSVLCNQISPKHVHDTSASRSIFFVINAQIVLKFSPHLARRSPIICHTKILPIGSKYLHKADICSPKQNCTPNRRLCPGLSEPYVINSLDLAVKLP